MACQKPIPSQKRKSGGLYHGRRNVSQEEGFALRCRKCLDCRLNTGREKAIRCYHETKMHKDSIFLTLTYKELRSTKLPELYVDIQLFMKSLLEYVNRGITASENRIHIPFMVTGEYGDENKRPHWHILLFNFRPSDAKKKRTNRHGDILYTSEMIDRLWGHNDPKKAPSQFGEVTLESAGYVARYAAKKLTHGKDQDHEFHPFHRTSSKHAIGKTWIEKYWQQTFQNGYVTVFSKNKDGETKPIRAAIPRFYCDWLKKHHPVEFQTYQDTILKDLKENAKARARAEEEEFAIAMKEHIPGTPLPKKRSFARNKILEAKFSKLQKKDEKL